jgi:hypothetical protein
MRDKVNAFHSTSLRKNYASQKIVPTRLILIGKTDLSFLISTANCMMYHTAKLMPNIEMETFQNKLNNSATVWKCIQLKGTNAILINKIQASVEVI